jgi:UDP-N-acetylglucosamine enolpyruvyl transferase
LDKYVIKGGNPLTGEVSISGAKNAAVAIIPAVILCDDACIIENLPDIRDVHVITGILEQMGAKVEFLNKSTVRIDPRTINTCEVPFTMAKRMRASYYLIGALLGKNKKARVPMPGGCDFGVRPIDQHLKGFEALGAKVSIDYTIETIDTCIESMDHVSESMGKAQEAVTADLLSINSVQDNIYMARESMNQAKASISMGIIDVSADVLIGNRVDLDIVSVGATINIILAAVKSNGLTIIENAAKEPHIVDLANFVNSMGADIRGAGTDVIRIYGVEHLRGTQYSIIPDQIEAGTYMVAAAATKGDVIIRNIIPKHLESITAKLLAIGLEVTEEYYEDNPNNSDAIRVRYVNSLKKCNIKTMPHPGFPTDMQPQMAVLLSLVKGISTVTEGVWENRFKYFDELKKMGVKAQISGQVATIYGMNELNGANVRAVDLRAGAAVVIAGLAASGSTCVCDIYHVERGYEKIIQKLKELGADIEKIEED